MIADSSSQLKISFSKALEDPEWDSFLEGTCLGQFQQSSCWARVKAVEGWQCSRCVLRGEEAIIGGFQILWKQTRLGRIGYVSKGPVLEKGSAKFVEDAVEILQGEARRLRLAALIVQPPDFCRRLDSVLSGHQFYRNYLQPVISTTWITDVSQGVDELWKGMRRSKRAEVRQATRRGTLVREGTAKDADFFFSVMLDTCKRQGQKPNPSSVELVRTVCMAFGDRARLTIAGCRGEPVAGLLCIAFGERVTHWKKGWNGSQANCRPNELLAYEALDWAATRGFKYCDFAALNRGIASTLFRGETISAEQMKLRDFFNIGFGGKPLLLPESKVWVRNSVAKMGYRAWCYLSGKRCDRSGLSASSG